LRALEAIGEALQRIDVTSDEPDSGIGAKEQGGRHSSSRPVLRSRAEIVIDPSDWEAAGERGHGRELPIPSSLDRAERDHGETRRHANERSDQPHLPSLPTLSPKRTEIGR
jgi:hypothetical protein